MLLPLETGLWNNQTQAPFDVQTSVQTLASHDSTLSAETNCLGLIQHCVGCDETYSVVATVLECEKVENAIIYL